jgi:hypothetical protein
MKEAFSFVNENVVGVVAALSTVVTVSGWTVPWLAALIAAWISVLTLLLVDINS